MSLFRGSVERRADKTLNQLLTQLRGAKAHAGVFVNDESAMRHNAVWASVNKISQTGAMLPVGQYRRQDDRRVEVPKSNLLTAPSVEVPASVWRRQVLLSWLLRGNAFGQIQAVDNLGYPTQLEILHPDAVSVERSNGALQFRLNGAPVELWPLGELWHEPGIHGVPGSPLGLSPIRYARETVGLGLAAEEFGARWFGDGAHPSGVLESEQAVDGVTARAIKERVKETIYGRREVAVLGAGTKWKQIQIAPEESQFLETRRANVADVARWFGLEPEDIGGATEGKSVTYANREQRALDFITYRLSPWLLRLEEALDRLLPRGQYVKVNVDALLRTDALTRAKVHDVRLRNGTRSRNEVRRLEDEEPIPTTDGDIGDEYLWPPYRGFPLPSDEEANHG